MKKQDHEYVGDSARSGDFRSAAEQRLPKEEVGAIVGAGLGGLAGSP